MADRPVMITVPRSRLVVAALWCILAGMSVVNTTTARENGYSPFLPAIVAVMALGLAIYDVWEASRPEPVGPVPRVERETPVS